MANFSKFNLATLSEIVPFKILFFSVQVGSETDFILTKTIIKKRGGKEGEKDVCADYDYKGFLDCFQAEIRYFVNFINILRMNVVSAAFSMHM